MDLSFRCRCGKVEGRVVNVEESRGIRMICLCDDCQAYLHYLGQAKEVLDANGGSDIVGFRPSSLRFTKGEEELRCLRLSAKGLLRYYTACCKSPIGNQMNSGRLPYLGFYVIALKRGEKGRDIEDKIGPMRGRLKEEYGIPPVPKGTKTGLRELASIAGYLISGMIKGEHKPSPFFQDGKLVLDTYILSPHEREELQKYCGPHPAKV